MTSLGLDKDREKYKSGRIQKSNSNAILILCFECNRAETEKNMELENDNDLDDNIETQRR